MSADHDRVEKLAQDHFGSSWAEDPRLRRFISATKSACADQSGQRAWALRSPYLGGLEPEEAFRQVLDTMPGAVFWKDLDSKFVRVNLTFARDHGYYEPEDAVGRSDFDLSDVELAQVYRADDQRVFRSGQAIMRQRERATRNCQAAWLETNKVPIRDRGGQVCGLLGTYTDITEQVNYEENLRAACSELAEASRFKDMFMAAISHELRTPLNPILSLSQSLSEGLYGEIDDRQRGALEHIEGNAKKLHRLIEDILDVSALEFGEKVEIVQSPVTIPLLLNAVAGRVQTSAAEKGIGVEISEITPGDVHVFLDFSRVQRILGILADNAVKFTRAGGAVTLAAEADEQQRVLSIHVSDNGFGISDEGQLKLFQTFTQLDRKLARSHNGAGLGLALAKRLAQQHGGDLRVQSAIGIGSRFTLELPLRTRYCEVA